ncbi:MAG: hypothetical protein HKN00_00615 [Flavobacteriaceae bacterium]|nr:hypothetical protein [Flavobacteriaceae bacterium]
MRLARPRRQPQAELAALWAKSSMARICGVKTTLTRSSNMPARHSETPDRRNNRYG